MLLLSTFSHPSSIFQGSVEVSYSLRALGFCDSSLPYYEGVTFLSFIIVTFLIEGVWKGEGGICLIFLDLEAPHPNCSSENDYFIKNVTVYSALGKWWCLCLYGA